MVAQERVVAAVLEPTAAARAGRMEVRADLLAERHRAAAERSFAQVDERNDLAGLEALHPVVGGGRPGAGEDQRDTDGGKGGPTTQVVPSMSTRERDLGRVAGRLRVRQLLVRAPTPVIRMLAIIEITSGGTR